MTEKTNSNDAKTIIKRLDEIRSLLVLIASKSGASQTQIATLLDIQERTVRKWLNPKAAR